MASENLLGASLCDVTLASVGFPADTWAEKLSDDSIRHPSLFGRLIAASSLKDDWQRHEHALAKFFGAPQFESELKRLHLRVFMAWLGLPLRRQKADLDVYLDGVSDKWNIVGSLQGIGERVLPTGSVSPERNLFLRDVAVLRILIHSERASNAKEAGAEMSAAVQFDSV